MRQRWRDIAVFYTFSKSVFSPYLLPYSGSFLDLHSFGLSSTFNLETWEAVKNFRFQVATLHTEFGPQAKVTQKSESLYNAVFVFFFLEDFGSDSWVLRSIGNLRFKADSE